MSELAQIIYTIEGIPHDLNALFNNFTDTFTKKDFLLILSISLLRNLNISFCSGVRFLMQLAQIPK
ncbi:hypothetical protein LCGC14_1395880 [marine sediment metagenome]|uniref:Uncharacterized protein n=1 Tax=marine sediment metagenome TaxID=412755 RepID=A0A0F9JYM4_9ZZZZ